MSEFILHGHPRSGNAYKPALLFALCDVPFEFRFVDVSAGAQRTPEFLAKNPFGQVPVVEHGERILVQSGAILHHVSRHTGRFGGANEDERQRILEWLLWEQDTLFPGVGRTRFFKRVGGAGPGLLEWLEALGNRALDQLDARLRASTFLAGPEPTIADVAAFGYGHLYAEGGFDLDHRPAVAAWLDRIRALPGFATPETLMPAR